MIRDILLVVGLLLSVSTQLRIPGLPVGLGEICLVAWILSSLGRFLYRLDVPLPLASFRLLAFWVLLVVALSVGTMTAYVIGDIHDAGLFLHDIAAYVLVGSIGLFCVVEPHGETRLQRLSWLLVVLGSLFLALQLAHAWKIVNFLEIEPWFFHRFRGWSANSNALALLCLILAMLSVHLAETSTRFGEKIVAAGCIILPILAGILTDSDAFMLALVLSCAIFLILKFWKSLYSKPSKRSFSSLSKSMVMLALPLFMASAIPIAWMLGSGFEGNEAIISSEKSAALAEEAEERFQLWEQALRRGAESGMLGLGPGPHLKYRQPKLQLKKLNADLGPPPPIVEAHNTLLDLFVQGGILAVISIFCLGIITTTTILKAGKQALAALLFGIAIFGSTHFIIRSPNVWFVVAMCLVAPEHRRPTPATAWS